MDLEQTVAQNQTDQYASINVHHDFTNIRPTSSEINHLWSTYMAESMSVAFLKHMVTVSKDPDFHEVLQLSLDESSQNIKALKDLFNTMQYPGPEGFGEKDVNINAPELYTEEFSVKYTKLMQKYILMNHSLAFSDSSRPDIKNLFSQFNDKAKKVIEKIDQVLLAKGLFQKSPFIEFPDQIEYVHDKSYSGSFWDKSDRPLNTVEISNIFNIIEFKIAMRALIMGFAQVAKSEQVRKHMIRGIKMADKQLEVLGILLENDGLPKPEFINNRVTDSTQSPYSDKLMMFHTSIAMAHIILIYGLGLTNSSRKDIVSDFSRLMAEILQFSKTGLDIMIENGWLEKVPETVNRQELTKLRH